MKILLVDDSKSARYALRLQLQSHGIEVETAESAESALELLKGSLPDAILMDHMMPGLSGFDALEIIRSDARTAHIPVAICTSHEDPDFAAAASRKGVAAILPKSVAAEKLPEVLARLRAPIGQSVDPRPVRAPAAPAPAGSGAPKAALDPVLLHQLETRIDERVETRLAHLIEPLERDLGERLLAETRRFIESRLAATREALTTPLAEHQQVLQARLDAHAEELQTAAGRLVEGTLPDLVRTEVEAERGRVLDLVDQYLREFSPRAPARDAAADRLAALDGAVGAEVKAIARREADDACDSAVDRTQRLLDEQIQQVRASLTRVYLGILGSALIGVVGAILVYLLLRGT